MNKFELRKEILKKRILLPKNILQINSKIISDIILNSYEYKKSDNILTYFPVKGEIDTTNIISDTLNKGKTVALPRIDNNTMSFYEISSLDALEIGTFGLYEPKSYCSKCNLNKNTLLIAPGVAFDKNKNRLGYGKGYFDIYLSSHSHKNLIVIGICHDFQILSLIPHNKYDVKMDILISEKQIIK